MNFFKRLMAHLAPEGHDEIEEPKQDQKTAVFALTFDKIFIGTLVFQDGQWVFSYEDSFKTETRIRPLTDFPDVHKVYKMTNLHPFFTLRIPSLQQPKVKQVIAQKQIDKTDLVALLHEFGRKTITNPFTLSMQ
jgi:HipA-like protein